MWSEKKERFYHHHPPHPSRKLESAVLLDEFLSSRTSEKGRERTLPLVKKRTEGEEKNRRRRTEANCLDHLRESIIISLATVSTSCLSLFTVIFPSPLLLSILTVIFVMTLNSSVSHPHHQNSSMNRNNN